MGEQGNRPAGAIQSVSPSIPAALIAALVVALGVSCGGDDSRVSSLQTEVTALQTQIALPAPTALPTPSPAPQTDRVVSIIYGCSVSTPQKSGGRVADVQPKYPQGGGGICEDAARKGKFNPYSPDGTIVFDLRLDLTIRTPSGSTYQASIGGPSTISIGDEWPPK